MLSIDYFGSKNKLLPILHTVFSKYIDKDTIFGDLFSGTSIVSHSVSTTYNCKVISNDLQYYSYVLQRANLTKYSDDEINIIKDKIEEYNNLDHVVEGFITQNYSPPERMYFTTENAQLIDTIRYKLEEDRKNITDNVYYYLLASLLSSTSSVSNVSCQFASYLKKFKERAQKKMKLKDYESNNVKKRNQTYNKDIMDILNIKYDVVYLDPPYNSRQYACYYHILETIAKNDNPNINGKTGMRDYSDQKSLFCSKNTVLDEFDKLISKLNSKIVILSYNDEGLMSHNDIKKVLKKNGKVEMYKKEYRKFKAQTGVERKNVYEYIFVLEKINDNF